MELKLTPVEARILGALIEKETTTPDYYPLTLNALTNACNQKSNRHPVMNMEEKAVAAALEQLRYKKLIWQVSPAGARVIKYRHNITQIHPFTPGETAVLCELFLRGPQTLGELRTHSARLHEFPGLAAVEQVLTGLSQAEKGPFVQKLPREAGRRENRYAHLLCGEIGPQPETSEASLSAAVLEVRADTRRLEELEKKVDELKQELDKLKGAFSSFRRQFE